MPADIYEGVRLAMMDALNVAGQDFIWNGNTYQCILNAEQNTLTTSKSLFAASGYPLQGDKIRVANKDRQVEAIGNSDAEFVAGGIAGDKTFVDDPNNPSLIILFNSFIGK